MSRLDEIQAQAEGLTDLCAEHLRQSIRHVQRNCDIDCNVHEDVDAWDACKQPDRYDGDRMAAVLSDMPFLLDLARKQQAALDAVEKLLSDAEEVMAVVPSHYGGLWINSVRAVITKALEANP